MTYLSGKASGYHSGAERRSVGSRRGDTEAYEVQLEDGLRVLFRRLDLASGQRLLDVGCGSGLICRLAAFAGASATGCDSDGPRLHQAELRANTEELNVSFVAADPTALPFANGSFDVVTRLLSSQVPPNLEQSTTELLRVCRPGGRIVLAHWTPEGFMGQVLALLAPRLHLNTDQDLNWGQEVRLRECLAGGATNVLAVRRVFHFHLPYSPAGAVEFFRMNYGPVASAFAGLNPGDQQDLRSELTTLIVRHNLLHSATRLPVEYLEVVATKVGDLDDSGGEA